MNRISMTLAALTLVTSLAACGKKKEGEAGGGGGEDKKGPAITINEADWVPKNLHDVAPLINITMKVPKDAKLEKNGNGGVDIRVSPVYQITVSNIAVSNVAEAIKSDKSLTVDAKDKYSMTKVLSEEPNGFVYTIQMKPEENGNTYEAESHFAFYVEKDGAIYSILDDKPLDAFSTPGSTYTTDVANKVYGIVKGSAKAN